MLEKLNNDIFTLQWDYSPTDAANIDGFWIWLQAVNAAPRAMAAVKPQERSFTMSCDYPSQTVGFYVTAIRAGVHSDPSNVAEIKFSAAPNPPNPSGKPVAPANLRIS